MPGALVEKESKTMSSPEFRIEQDFLGQREIADDIYYGVQTIRGKENFHITGIPMNQEPYFVKALGYVKKAAAMANRDLGALDAKVAEAIIRGLRSRHRRRHDGSVRHRLHPGRRRHLHQHERQRGDRQSRARNCSASRRATTSTSAPTIMSITASRPTTPIRPRFGSALILRLESYMTALRQLQEAFFVKGREFDRVLKMGRTHLQDAVPMSLGAEFRGWGTTIGEEVDRISEARALLREINLGATAIGTSVTAAPGYPKLAVRHLSEHHRRRVHPRRAISSRRLRTPAPMCSSPACSSAPRASSPRSATTSACWRRARAAGFNEINLPQLQPGSSIMPGKVNPVIPEVVNQTSFLVIGLDITVTLAASAGQLQLNVMEPVITFALFFRLHHGARGQ